MLATIRWMRYINMIHQLLRDAICLAHNSELFEPMSSGDQDGGGLIHWSLSVRYALWLVCYCAFCSRPPALEPWLRDGASWLQFPWTETMLSKPIISSLFFLFSWGGVRLSPLGTPATGWPTVPASDDRWCVWNSELAREREVVGENLPQCHLVHHKSYMTWPGHEPGQPWWEAGE
jgi:hypothetical protein